MITNRVPSRVRRMLQPRLSVLYRPVGFQWSYCHHASLCAFQGMLHAIWSNGERDEDDLRQRVMHAISKDGENWSMPEILFDSEFDKVLTACGLYNNGKALVAYAGCYSYSAENVADGRYKVINDLHRGTTLLAKCTTDGINWDSARDLHVPIVPNHGPQALKNGRLLICGNVTFPYTDQKDGLGGWQVRGLAPCPWQDMQDDSEGLTRHIGLRGDDTFLCEGSYFQTDDGLLHMLLRSDKRVLYETVSTDNGETWSTAKHTEFSFCNTKFHCGQLPDGRYYIVGSPDPTGARCPLVISLSKDGEVFDEEYVIDDTYRPQRMPGKYKGGIYGYPHSFIVGEKMFVICSINKEDIYVYSFELNQLKIRKD